MVSKNSQKSVYHSYFQNLKYPIGDAHLLMTFQFRHHVLLTIIDYHIHYIKYPLQLLKIERSGSPISNLSIRSHNSAKTTSSLPPDPCSRLSKLTNDELVDSDSEEPLFITKPSSHLLCNICNRVMRRPVITQ